MYWLPLDVELHEYLPWGPRWETPTTLLLNRSEWWKGHGPTLRLDITTGAFEEARFPEEGYWDKPTLVQGLLPALT